MKKLPITPWKSSQSEFSRAAHRICSFAFACRLVDILLGAGAAAPHKLECANPLTVLGVQTKVDAAGVTFKPNPAKVAEWTDQIQSYLKLGLLSSGDASKLAGELASRQRSASMPLLCTGRLSFASQHVFKRLGRALLVPIFKQIRSRSAAIKPELQMALTWWLQTLKLGMSEVNLSCQYCRETSICLLNEVRPWGQIQDEPLHLLCDARSVRCVAQDALAPFLQNAGPLHPEWAQCSLTRMAVSLTLITSRASSS